MMDRYVDADWPPRIDSMLLRIRKAVNWYLTKAHKVRCVALVAVKHIEQICKDEVENSFTCSVLWDLPVVFVKHIEFLEYHEFEILLLDVRWAKSLEAIADITITIGLRSGDRLRVTKQDVWN